MLSRKMISFHDGAESRQILFSQSSEKIIPEELTYFIKHLSTDNAIHDICECLFNLFKIDLKLAKNKKLRIKNKFNNPKSRRNLNIITNSERDILKKRRALTQEGEGLGVVFRILTPLIKNLLSGSGKHV